MIMNKFILPIFLALPLLAISCTSTGSITPIEEMTENDYAKWRLYLQLGVKIGANRLLQEEIATEEEMTLAANALEALRDQSIASGATSLIEPALRNAGLNNDEVVFILLVVEQELLSRGALEWINQSTGMLELSPRTKELLTVVAEALRSAIIVTPAEASQANQMNADFGRD